jgi:hypothetical protein
MAFVETGASCFERHRRLVRSGNVEGPVILAHEEVEKGIARTGDDDVLD